MSVPSWDAVVDSWVRRLVQCKLPAMPAAGKGFLWVCQALEAMQTADVEGQALVSSLQLGTRPTVKDQKALILSGRLLAAGGACQAAQGHGMRRFQQLLEWQKR